MARVANGILTPIEARRRSARFRQGGLYVFLTVVAAACVLPPVWVMLSAMEPTKEFVGRTPIIPNHLSWSVVSTVFHALDFPRLYLNSAYYLIGALVTSLLFNGMLAFVLSKLRVHGTGLVVVLVLWTLMLPNTVAIAATYKNVIDFPFFGSNLSNTFFPLWLMAGGNAFYVLVFKAFFDSIDGAYLEAARIDGASNLTIFRRIIIPMSKPVFITVGILTTTYVWSDFFWPFMIETKAKTEPTMVGIYNAIGTIPYNEAVFSLVFGMLPPLVLFMVFQRYIMQGFTLGGLTG